MYAQLEAAGLITGTQEWKDKQDNKLVQALKEVNAHVRRTGNRQKDAGAIGQVSSICKK